MSNTQTHERSNEYWRSKIEEIQKRLNVEGSNSRDTSSRDNLNLAKTFDHTLLKLDATPEQIQDLCLEAKEYNFATVCVREDFVPQAALHLKDSEVRVCCVVGFHDPSASRIEEKLAEAKAAVHHGAGELDLVMNWFLIKSQEYEEAFRELKALRDMFPVGKIVIKVILETSQLSEEEIIAGCVLAAEADFDFVKTSTGFVGHGAKVEHVQLMRRVCELQKPSMAVKASGGIRTLQDADSMLSAGAGRLGASASVPIMQEFIKRTGRN